MDMPGIPRYLASTVLPAPVFEIAPYPPTLCDVIHIHILYCRVLWTSWYLS